MESINTAVETTEAVTGEQVAEAPENPIEEGSNETVVAEQSSDAVEVQDSSTNRAFQQMRKANEELQRQLDALEAEKKAREETYNRLVGADASDISVIAEASGLSEDEVRAEFAHSQENYEKDMKIQSLEQQLIDIEAEKAMQEDLQAIRRIDPSIKSLDSLGESFLNYINAGLNAEDAYWAIKSKEQAHKSTPPKEIGKVVTAPAEKEHYSWAEINAMSSEEKARNWKKILNSM